MAKPILYYIYDPMCSWCWGYQPTWLLLQQQLESRIQIHTLVGGLAEDSNALMPETMQDFLQETWHKISAELGTQFNFNFWSQCQPKRSTYPACRYYCETIPERTSHMFGYTRSVLFTRAESI